MLAMLDFIVVSVVVDEGDSDAGRPRG